ncbi:hypothetical protein M0R72_20640 [Candidatus Pacearchaeota archaeon]|jgi:uncharacterized RDD family membrane protein YckC|nr:hypothetical protein [Candidatus Pacearchaeota archaeon]
MSSLGEGLIATVLIVLMVWSILLVAVWRGDATILSTVVTGMISLVTAIAGYWFGTRGKTSGASA